MLQKEKTRRKACFFVLIYCRMRILSNNIEYHPISFITKRNRVVPERKVYTPLQFAPANAVPFLGD